MTANGIRSCHSWLLLVVLLALQQVQDGLWILLVTVGRDVTVSWLPAAWLGLDLLIRVAASRMGNRQSRMLLVVLGSNVVVGRMLLHIDELWTRNLLVTANGIGSRHSRRSFIFSISKKC